MIEFNEKPMQLVNGRLLHYKNHHYNEQILNKSTSTTNVKDPTILNCMHTYAIYHEKKIPESQVNFEDSDNVKVQQMTNQNLQYQSFFSSDGLIVTPIPLTKTSLLSPLVKNPKSSSMIKDCNVGIPIQLDSQVKSNINNDISESAIPLDYSKKHSWIKCENKNNCCTNNTDLNNKLLNLSVENGGSLIINKLTSDKSKKFQNCLPIKDRSYVVLKMDVDKANITGDNSRQNSFNKEYSNKGSLIRPTVDESKTHLCNKKSTENLKTSSMGQTSEDELVVLNDYSIIQTNYAKEQASSNFKPKMVVNKSYKNGGFSNKNNFSKISSVKCNTKCDDGTRYQCVSRNQHCSNIKQNNFKNRISTLWEMEDGCIRTDISSSFSKGLNNVSNGPFKHKDKCKEQDNTKKDCHSKINLIPQLGINSSNTVVNISSFLEKNKLNKIQNYNSEQVSMTQKAANRIEKNTPSTGGCIMKLKPSKISNSVMQSVTTVYTNDISDLNINSTCIQNSTPENYKFTSLEQNCNIQNLPIIVIDDSSDSYENSSNIEKGLQNKSINIPIESRCNIKQSFYDKNKSALQLATAGFSGKNKVNKEPVNFQKIPLISQNNVPEKLDDDDTKQNKSNKEITILKKTEFNEFIMNKNSFKPTEKLTKVKNSILSGQHNQQKKLFYEAKLKECTVSNSDARIITNNLIQVRDVTKSDEIPTSIEKSIQIKDDGLLKNQKEILPTRCVDRIRFSQICSRRSIFRPTFKTKYTSNKIMKKENTRRKCNLCGRLIKCNSWLTHLQGIHNLYQYFCNLCGKSQTNQRLSINHAKLHFLNECYPCDRCSKQFYNGMMLVEHLRKEHRVFVPFQCQKCDVLFEEKKCLRRHNLFDSCNPISQPKCIECNIIFQQKKNLGKHQKKVHGKKPQIDYYCEHCNVHFKFKESVKIHLKARHSENALKYKKKSDVSYIEKTLRKHHTKEYIENINKCDQSIKLFFNFNDFPNKLDRLMETTNRDIDVAIEYDDNLIERLNRPNECVFNRNNCIDNTGKFVKMSYDRIDFPNEYAYSKNEWLKKLLEFADETCGINSKNIYEYGKARQCTNKPKKLFNDCNAKRLYNELSKWRNEMRISRRFHKKMLVTFSDWLENPQMKINKIRVPMEMRGKKHNTVLSPKHNIFELPTLQRMHRCSVCYKTFSTQSLFLDHILTDHKTNELYECKSCDKEFSNKSTLELHQAFHTVLDKYTCDLCSMSFITAVDFKRHDCTEKKSLKCEVCYLDFVKPKYLKIHQNIHKNNTNYICEFCPEFTSSCIADLQEHIRLNHGFPALDWSKF
jgi:hypothetical protein